MTINEKAVHVADKYAGHITPESKIKKLGEEVIELAMAIKVNDMDNMEEEIGDCLYILLHLAYQKFGTTNLDDFIKRASDKMISRNL